MARPKCPNHTVEMTPTDERRIFICPISDARFECDVEEAETETKIDKFGNQMFEWKITPLDGDGG